MQGMRHAVTPSGLVALAVYHEGGAHLQLRFGCLAAPLEKMTRLFFEMNAFDIQTRISNEGRVPLAPLVHVHEIRDGGGVMTDDNVKVTAALVDHPRSSALKESILAHQTSAEDAGRIAERAGVKVLVLSHLVPADDLQVTEEMWIQAAQSRFRGTVILGKDLLEI